MCHSPMMRIVYFAVVGLAALGSIHLGLLAMGHDMLAVLRLSHMMKTLYMIFGVAGVASLVFLVLKCCSRCTSDHCNCGTTTYTR